MRTILGFWCLIAGIALTLQLNPSEPVDPEEQVAAVTRIIAQGPATNLLAATSEGSEPADVAPPAVATPPETSPEIARAVPAAAPAPLPAPAPVWRTDIRPAAVAAPAPPTGVQPVLQATRPKRVSPAASGSYRSERALARDIQRELKRLGCYYGKIDGVWGGASRDAMATFLSRVNAALPVEEPDVILLSLSQGHEAGVCEKECPIGETLASGRCVPQAIVASVSGAGAPQRDRTAPIVTAARPRSEFDGRMSIGGPVGEPPQAVERLPWQTPVEGQTRLETAAIESAEGVVGPLGPADGSASPLAAVPQVADEPPASDRVQARPPRPQRAKDARRSAKKERNARQWRGQRSVQSLFIHPLGRL